MSCDLARQRKLFHMFRERWVKVAAGGLRG